MHRAIKIEVHMMDMQVLAGGNDRDLFTIAFVTATANGPW